MSQCLPVGKFSWVTERWTKERILSLQDDALEGYIFEVDLSVLDEDHDKFNDYPLAPQTMVIDEAMLSPYQERFPDHQKKASTKLTPNLFPKKKYVTHYRNLKFYLEQGMQLDAVHRVMKFDQSPWLAKFIDYNTAMRSMSTNSFGKDFFKLMNNSTFGKTQACILKLAYNQSKFFGKIK